MSGRNYQFRKSLSAFLEEEGVRVTPDELGLEVCVKDPIFGEFGFSISWDLATVLATVMTILIDRKEEGDYGGY